MLEKRRKDKTLIVEKRKKKGRKRVGGRDHTTTLDPAGSLHQHKNQTRNIYGMLAGGQTNHNKMNLMPVF